MKIIEKIFDIESGEERVVEREETLAEKKARELEEQNSKELALVLAEKAKLRAALLQRLGITEEEAKLLLS